MSYKIQNIAVYCRILKKNIVFRGNSEKSQFIAENGKNRDIAHTVTNPCLCHQVMQQLNLFRDIYKT